MPGGKGALVVIVNSLKSKEEEQLLLLAAITPTPGTLTAKSLPLAARELHFISLFNFTVILVPSQAASAVAKAGSLGSVITAVPPLKFRP